MDRFAAMQAFRAVAELGTFTGAAQRLDVSKSVISKQVAALEGHLGVRLLNRTTRRLHLTEAGVQYLERCQSLLGELEDLELSVRDLDARPRGRLRVNAPVSFGHQHLASAIPGLLALHPELEIDLTLNDRHVDLVNEGFDAAVRISRLEDSSLMARRITTSEVWVCGAPAYLDHAGRPERPEDLRAYNCLIYAYAQRAGEWRLTDAEGTEHRVGVAGNLRANNGEILLEAAIQGSGLILIPDFMAGPAVADGRLERLFADCDAGSLGVYVVYPYTRHVSAKLRAFIDYLLACFAGPAGPPWREIRDQATAPPS